jgi:hypothetical protein
MTHRQIGGEDGAIAAGGSGSIEKVGVSECGSGIRYGPRVLRRFACVCHAVAGDRVRAKWGFMLAAGDDDLGVISGPIEAFTCTHH